MRAGALSPAPLAESGEDRGVQSGFRPPPLLLSGAPVSFLLEPDGPRAGALVGVGTDT